MSAPTDTANVGAKRVLFVHELAANPCGRTRAVVREDEGTRSGAWDWAELRESCGPNTGAACFIERFHFTWPKDKPFVHVWRERID